jgi:DNA-binding SARP family transcriptional activator
VLLDSEQRFDSLDKGRELGIARTNLGGAFFELGDLESARKFAEAAVRSARDRQDLWGLGLALPGFGNVLFSQGEAEVAFEVMNESIEMLERADQGWLLAETIYRLAEMHRQQGELDRAEELFDRCFHLAQDIGALQWQLEALERQGFISLAKGRHGDAAVFFNEVLRLTPVSEYEGLQLQVITGLAEIAVHQTQWESAVTLWAASRELMAELELSSVHKDEPTLELLGEIVDSPTATPWIEAGIAMNLAQAITLAREIANGVMELEKPDLSSVSAAALSDYELRLLALGPTEVYLKGRRLAAPDWTFAKPKELLFYLASNPAQTKEQIGLVFWPDVSPNQLRTRLRNALYQLRRALDGRDWVHYENGQYAFNRQKSFWYDLEAFDLEIEQGEKLLDGDPEGARARFEVALQLYRGDFLTGLAEDSWGMVRREELRQRYLDTMKILGKLYLDTKDVDRAVGLFLQLTEADPFLEAGHRGLMRAYLQAGEKGQALNQFRRLQQLLDDELGVKPSSKTIALFQSIRE